MKSNLPEYKRFLFIGIILIALGVNFSTLWRDNFGAIGNVFIAIGGLFFIISMSKKRTEEAGKKEN